MKNTLFLLLLFIVLAGGAYYFLHSEAEIVSDSNRWDTSLTIADTDEIHKIFIAKKTGTSYTLTRNGDHWLVNGKHKVRPGKIRYILETLEKQRVRYIPSVKEGANIVKDIAGTGIKVETYDEKGEEILKFYVGGMNIDENGTFMIKEGSNQPLVMHIPSFVGGLRVRFWDSPENWRDRSVFNYNPADIESLKVDYKRDKSHSFLIEKEGNAYEVKPIYKTTSVNTKAVNQAVVEEYLGRYKSKIAENFANTYEKKDSILQMTPFCRITLKVKNKATEFVDFYPHQTAQSFETPDIPAYQLAKEGKIERYFINKNNEDFMNIQQIVFGKLFVSYDYFFR